MTLQNYSYSRFLHIFKRNTINTNEQDLFFYVYKHFRIFNNRMCHVIISEEGRRKDKMMNHVLQTLSHLYSYTDNCRIETVDILTTPMGTVDQ